MIHNTHCLDAAARNHLRIEKLSSMPRRRAPPPIPEDDDPELIYQELRQAELGWSAEDTLRIGNSVVVATNEPEFGERKLVTAAQLSTLRDLLALGVPEGWETKLYRGWKDFLLIWYMPTVTEVEIKMVAAFGKLKAIQPFNAFNAEYPCEIWVGNTCQSDSFCWPAVEK